VQARVLLGVTHYSLGDSAAALTEWKETLTVDPENKSAQMYVRMLETPTGALAGQKSS
jgi:hypothetical protein